MPKLPTLLPLNPKRPDGTDSVVLAVYAPFGTDAVLSSYPDGNAQTDRPAAAGQRACARWPSAACTCRR